MAEGNGVSEAGGASFKWPGLLFEAPDTTALSLAPVMGACHPPAIKTWEAQGSLFIIKLPVPQLRRE